MQFIQDFATRRNHHCFSMLPLDAPEALLFEDDKDIPQHSNAEPHTACQCMESIQKNDCEVLPHLPYCLGLDLSDIHLFLFVKDQV
jgi:hypothetical protein